MSLWKNRPLFACACVCMASSLTAFLLNTQIKLILIVASLAGAGMILCLCLLLRRKKSTVRHSFLASMLLLCMGLSTLSSYLTFDQRKSFLTPYIERGKDQATRVTATVNNSLSSSSSFSTYILDVETVDGKPFTGRAYLTCYYAAELSVGDQVDINASAVSSREAAGNIYTSQQLLGDGIFFGIISESHTQLHRTGTDTSLSCVLARHRKDTASTLNIALGKEYAGIPAALFLGEKQFLASSTIRDFGRSGVSHLLAISGLHMTVLFGALAWLLKRCLVPPRPRVLLLGAISFLYLAYLGFPPSATRAIVMLGFTYCATLLCRRADALTSLGTAGMGILLISPTTVADVGFWLSFSSVFGILTLLPLLKRSSPWGKNVLTRVKRKIFNTAAGLLTGVAAISTSLWIIASVIGEFSLFSSPMTLILTPLMGILLFCTPLYLLMLSTPVASVLKSLIQALTKVTEQLCEWASDTSFAVISLQGIPGTLIALLMMAGTLILLGISLPQKRKWLILTPILSGWMILFLCLGIHHTKTKNTVTADFVIPSSVSDMMVLTNAQHAVICDFSNGSGTSFSAAARQASDRGATEFSAIVLTHYHNATAGNLLWLMEREKVRALWLPSPHDEEEKSRMYACIQAAEATDVPVFVYTYEDSLPVLGLTSLSLRIYRVSLSRSVQPVLLATLASPQGCVTYCGRGIFESILARTAQHAINQSSAVFFGHHGPTLHEPFACNFSDDLQGVGFADAKVATHLSSPPPATAPSFEGAFEAFLPLKQGS